MFRSRHSLSFSRRFWPKPIDYEFVTIWRIAAPIYEVCEAISHSHHWPRWWRGVEQVMELSAENAHGGRWPAPVHLFHKPMNALGQVKNEWSLGESASNEKGPTAVALFAFPFSLTSLHTASGHKQP